MCSGGRKRRPRRLAPCRAHGGVDELIRELGADARAERVPRFAERALVCARMQLLPDGFELPDDEEEVTAEQRDALLRESAAYLHTPASTLHEWAHPKDGEPLVTVLPREGRRATVPFVGFAEASVLGTLRGAGVPMQRIRPGRARRRARRGSRRPLPGRRRLAEIAADFGVPAEEVQDVVRVALRPAA